MFTKLMNERQRLIALYQQLEAIQDDFFNRYSNQTPIPTVKGLDLEEAMEDLYARISRVNLQIAALEGIPTHQLRTAI
jgi:hypothetical protein